MGWSSARPGLMVRPHVKPSSSDEFTLEPQVTVPIDHYISISLEDIQERLVEQLPEAYRRPFTDFSTLLEAIRHYDFLDVRRRLKKNLRLFNPAPGGSGPRRYAAAGPAELEAKALQFVADFHALMAAAQYRLMRRAEWAVALSESFHHTLPVEVDWSCVDRRLLSAFVETLPTALRAELPAHASRVLVYHCGSGVVHEHGMYLPQKMDLLARMLVLEPLATVMSALTAGRVGGPGDAAAAFLAPAVGGDAPSVPGVSAPPPPGSYRAVERRTLRRLLPSAASLLASLFTVVELQEPVLRHVVVLYRRAPSPPLRGPVGAATAETAAADARRIHIASFGDVPMADAEIVFPAVRVCLPAVPLLAITAAVGAAVMAFVRGATWAALTWDDDPKNDEGGTGGKTAAVLALAAGLAGAAYRGWVELCRRRTEAASGLINVKFDRTTGAGEGVLAATLETMEEQQHKGALLAYAALLAAAPGGLSQSTLRERVESMLRVDFNALDVDYDARGPLRRLVDEGVVTVDAGCYAAVPLAEALRRLDAKWDNYYNYSRGGGGGGQAAAAGGSTSGRLPPGLSRGARASSNVDLTALTPPDGGIPASPRAWQGLPSLAANGRVSAGWLPLATASSVAGASAAAAPGALRPPAVPPARAISAPASSLVESTPGWGAPPGAVTPTPGEPLSSPRDAAEAAQRRRATAAAPQIRWADLCGVWRLDKARSELPAELLSFLGATAAQQRAAGAVAVNHVLKPSGGDLLLELHPGGVRGVYAVGATAPKPRDGPEGRVLTTLYIDGPRLVQEEYVESRGYTMLVVRALLDRKTLEVTYRAVRDRGAASARCRRIFTLQKN